MSEMNLHAAHIKLDCLRLAMELAHKEEVLPSDDDIRRIAENFYEFVTGTEHAD